MSDSPGELYQPYVVIGGDAAVRALVDRFYDLMDAATDPASKVLRDMHPSALHQSRDKLYWFLVGWLGGPQMYVERRGHPRLRARHLPFSIGIAERDAWMACMDQAIGELVTDADLRRYLHDALFRLADHMRNRPEENQ